MGKTVETIVGIAAVIAIAVFAPEIAPALVHLAAAIGIGISTAVATAIVTVGLSLAVSFAFKALGVGSVPKAKDQIGPPSVFRQSITDAFLLWGKRRIGGLLVFFHARQSGSDHFRYFTVACVGHQVHALVSWMLNDDVVTVDGSGKVTSGDYANACWLKFYRGTDSDVADPTFVSECGGNWTSAHQGLGVAKFYAKFQMTDAVVQAGMPNMTAIVEGRDEVYDPRTGTTSYSRNAELIFYDFMAMAREEGGFGAYDDEIPLGSWIGAEADVCDEVVNGNPRYALDAYLTTGAAPSEVRDSFVVNCAGTYTFSGGKHLMRPGHWVPVTASLGEKDLSAAIQVTPFLPADTASTQVSGTYISPADGYQGMPFTTWNRPDAADVTQIELDLAHTTVLDQADRVAAIMGKRAACEKQVVWPMNIVGIGIATMQTVQLDTSRYGLSNYAWVVSNWQLTIGDSWGAVLNLREENEEIYDDPVPASPGTPATIVQPSGPIVTGVPRILRASYPKNLSITSEDAGTSATIHLFGFTGGPGTDFTIDYASDPVQEVTVPHADITGLAYATLYYLYADVIEPGDAAPTYGATTVYGDAINSSSNPLRIYLNQLVTTPAAGGGTTGGTSGGGGYGGGLDDGGSDPCVTDDTLILMANDTRDGPGEAKAFRDCKINDWVWTRSEATGEMGAFRIARLRFVMQPIFDAGENYPRASERHRFEREDNNGWLYIESIGEAAGDATVGQLIVAGADTYMTARPGVTPVNWVLSHNYKP